MPDDVLIPGEVHGLRAWTVDGPPGEEALRAPHRGTTWPASGALTAACGVTPEHAAPAPGCNCGLHAWHPRPGTARRLLGSRGTVPGVMVAWGTIEVHEDGLRAQHARPHTFFAAPRANRALLDRLAARYGVPVVTVDGAHDVLEHCRRLGLGLDPAVVAELLGPERVALAATRRRRERRGWLRVAVALAVGAAMAAAGSAIFTDPPGPRVLTGRAGEVTVGSPR
jgi:hypothetical protein